MATLRFSRALLFLLTIFSSLQSIFITCTQFEVGGNDGWAVPDSKDGDVYNHWASQNRFLVNDTIHFKYEEDSVMVVTSDDYDKCKSSHPISYFNNGDTIFTLDRPGYFYFISGVSGHCRRGLKMIVKVLEPHHHPTTPPAASQNSTSGASTVVDKTAGTSLGLRIVTISAMFGFLLLRK